MSGERVAVTLPPKPESAGRAREWVADAVDGNLAPSSMHTLRLLVTEVVANAVLHGDGQAPLELALTGEPDIRVEVTDQGTGFVPTPRAAAEEDPGGWGLFLVGELADRWGVESGPPTRVWFCLPPTAHEPRPELRSDAPGLAGGHSREERAAVVEIALRLADSNARSGSFRRALMHLDAVKKLTGALPPEYVEKRRRWMRQPPEIDTDGASPQG